MENDTMKQLNKIAAKTEDALLRKGPGFFNDPNGLMPPPKDHGEGNGSNVMANEPNNKNQTVKTTTGAATNVDNMIRFYFMLDRSLRETLSMLNADYVLIDSKENILTLPQDFAAVPDALMAKIKSEFTHIKASKSESYISFSSGGSSYIGILKPVGQKNTFGLGWVLIYSSLDKINQLQLGVNAILLVILFFSAVVAALLSSVAAKRISQPFSTLNEHIGSIAERNFGNKLQVKVDDELKEFVSNINIMSEKLEQYDKAQKTFLQNASHEFRTPLTSIQSYAEGIKYNVVESDVAADVIIDETKRMTNLVTDLLYLSRLEAIEESYSFHQVAVWEMLQSCKYRTDGIAIKNNIEIEINRIDQENGANVAWDKITINCDEEKLSRAITNIIGNCIRYAKKTISVDVGQIRSKNARMVNIIISDDGPGFKEDELPHIFERFYKGTKGNYGLGLAITKNIIEKHNGTITAYNSENGAVFEIRIPMGDG